MASPLQLETPEEKRRRIEQEKLAEMQSSISIPATPIEKEPSTSNFWDQYDTPFKDLVDSTKLPPQIRYDKDYSIEDLDKDKHFQAVANRWLTSIGTDDDIYETLRDSDWSITGAVLRAYKSGKWTEQQKADYRYLRTKFDNADVGGLRHILEATKDIGIDIIADPLNLIAALFIVGSGGLGVAGATAASRIAGSMAVKEGAKKLANQKGFRAVSMGLTEGAYDAGLINASTQVTEIQTAIRQSGTEFDIKEAGLAAGLGGTIGASLVGGGYKLANYMLRKEHDKISKSFDMTDELLNKKGFIDSEKVRSVRKTIDKINSYSVGKPLTKFVEDAKDKTVFRQLLLHLRADTFRRAVIGVRKEKIEKANLTFSRDADALSNTGTTFIGQALLPLHKVSEGDTFLKRFFSSNKKLSEENDIAMWSLMARGNILDKYITITPVVPTKPLHAVDSKILQSIHSTSIETKLPDIPSGILRKNRLSQDELNFLRQYTPTQLEAAAKLRYSMQTFHRLGSNIDAIDPKTGKPFTEGKRIYDESGKAQEVSLLSIKDTDPKRYNKSKAENKRKDPLLTDEEIDNILVHRLIPYSLFDPDQKVFNYLPWKWVSEVVTEKRDILIPKLAKTNHAKPDNTYVKVKGIVEGTAKGKKGKGGIERDYIEDLSTGKEETVLLPYLTKDQIYFKDLKTKNLPHISKDGEAEEWLGGRYDTFEDIAIADFKKEGIIIPGVRRTPEEQIALETRSSLYRAEALADDLIQREARPDHRLSYDNYKAGIGSKKTEFLNTRNWHELDDQFLIDNGFIQTDVSGIMTDYAWKIGHKIKEEKFLGYGNAFYRRYLDEIEEELGSSKETRDILNSLSKARDYATGGRLSNVELGKFQKGLYDAVKISQILAHLPFATLSSITEPLIALGRSDLADTPAFVREFGKGIGKSTKKSMQRFYDHMQAARGKEIKGFRDLSDEDWLEAYRAGVATEQAMMSKIEGMFAEGLQTASSRNIINAFFNINFLQQWTQGVQLGAFNFAKERSIRIIGELADDTNAYGIQLTRNARNRRADQLREIGIEPREGVAAYRRSLDKNDLFNRDKFNEDSFYDTELIPSSALFSKEIILNPTAAELNKPMWFNNPGAAILVQVAGYPTAFNNTVLKGFARDTIRYPMANLPKVTAAAGMMAGTATMMNAIRSGGESLERKKDLDIVIESFERPGLLGWGQHFWRWYEGMKYGAGPVGSTLKSISGPFGGDVVDGIAYRTPWFLIAGTNLPGYGALTPQAKRDWKKFLKSIFDKKEYDKRLNRAKGGVVEDVLNVISEPDERKMRGQPFTYSGAAGHLFQDEEERGAFAEGGKASITETDEMYSYLTKDEDAYNIQFNSNPISIYTEEDLPDLDIKETYYTGFKDNTVSDRLNSVRQSSTIGLPVTTDKKKARGAVRLAGKIKFNNVLELDIDSPTPEAVQAELNKNMDSLVKIDSILGKEIIKAVNDNFQIRDDVLNDDPNLTPEKEAVIARNKSFLVRHELLKLGYDAIKTKEGYTLLRENQFLPTEIIKKGFKGGGLASTLNRRQGYWFGGLASMIARRGIKGLSKAQKKELKVIEKHNKSIGKKLGLEKEEIADTIEYYKGEKLGEDLYPERDFPDIPLSYSSTKLTRRWLEDSGIEDLDFAFMGYIRPPKNSSSNFYIDRGNNKYTIFEWDGKKHTQKTLNNPTLEELRSYFGYAKGGLVSLLQRRQQYGLGGRLASKLATKLSHDMTFGEQRIFIGKNRHLQYTPEGKNLGIGWHDVTGMESSKKLTPREQLKKQLDTFPKIKDKSGEQYWKFVDTLIDNNFEMAKGSAWATSGGRGRKVIMYNYTTGDAVTMDMKRINLTKNKKILVRFHDNNTSIRTHHRSFKNSKKFWSPKSLDTFLKKMFENK